jgi:hypothetical protein
MSIEKNFDSKNSRLILYIIYNIKDGTIEKYNLRSVI